MDWTQFVVFILSNIVFTLTLWLWNRSESRTDNRRCLDLIESIKNDAREFHMAMQNEAKDFHGRLERQDAEFKAHIIYEHSKNK